MKNLIEGLQEEINRVREIIKIYQPIPAGALAAHLMGKSVQRAENSIASGDTVEMMRCYEDLKGFEV